MLTLRIMPPRLISARDAGQDDDLVRFYFDRLWCNWRKADRVAAAFLTAAAAAIRCRRAAWRQGWGDKEMLFVSRCARPEAVLDMATRKGVHRLLNPGAFPLSANPLKNKHLFAESCAAAGLPVPETFSGTEQALRGWAEVVGAIIAKPNYSSKGIGVASFEGYSPELLQRWRQGNVLQRRLETHPALAAISPGALPSLRVMTCVNEAGAIEACVTLIRLSAGGDRPVDNFNAGNLVAQVDEAHACGPAWRHAGEGIEPLDRHPATGAAITGAPVPGIAEAEALAIAAHGLFREGFVVIGWDIGLTAGGPVLIEGNWNPGTNVLQLAGGVGLGATRLGRLYRWHLDRVPASCWRGARPVQWEPRT